MQSDVIIGAVIGLIIGVVIIILLGFVLRWLWNSTLPDVLGVKTVTTWQAIKIMLISSMLFGGHRAVSPPDLGAASPDTPTTQPAPN